MRTPKPEIKDRPEVSRPKPGLEEPQNGSRCLYCHCTLPSGTKFCDAMCRKDYQDEQNQVVGE